MQDLLMSISLILNPAFFVKRGTGYLENKPNKTKPKKPQPKTWIHSWEQKLNAKEVIRQHSSPGALGSRLFLVMFPNWNAEGRGRSRDTRIFWSICGAFLFCSAAAIFTDSLSFRGLPQAQMDLSQGKCSPCNQEQHHKVAELCQGDHSSGHLARVGDGSLHDGPAWTCSLQSYHEPGKA